MERRPIIVVNTDNYPTFCDNRCNIRIAAGTCQKCGFTQAVAKSAN